MFQHKKRIFQRQFIIIICVFYNHIVIICVFYNHVFRNFKDIDFLLQSQHSEVRSNFYMSCFQCNVLKWIWSLCRPLHPMIVSVMFWSNRLKIFCTPSMAPVMKVITESTVISSSHFKWLMLWLYSILQPSKDWNLQLDLFDFLVI
jgi:hypothetical protein